MRQIVRFAAPSPRLATYTKRIDERDVNQFNQPVVTFIRTQSISSGDQTSTYIVGAYERLVGTREYRELDLNDPVLRGILATFAHTANCIAHEEGADGNLITLFTTPSSEEIRRSAPPQEAEMILLFPEEQRYPESG